MTLLDCSIYSMYDTRLGGCTMNNLMQGANITFIIILGLLIIFTIYLYFKLKSTKRGKDE